MDFARFFRIFCIMLNPRVTGREGLESFLTRRSTCSAFRWVCAVLRPGHGSFGAVSKERR